MRARWAYNWVLWLSHHKKTFLAILSLASVLNLIGLTQVDFAKQQIGLMLLSLLLMSLMSVKLLDSFRTGLLMFGFSLYLILMVLSGFGWMGVTPGTQSVLGWVVVMTVMMSHLVHYLSAVLREMARGTFQYDAVAEALSLTAKPILLSSLTTALGFMVAASINETYVQMAWIVGLGTALSLLVVVTWLPTILLGWLLEFRVGHYEDRHGLVKLQALRDKYHWFDGLVKVLFSGMLGVSLIQLWRNPEVFHAVMLMTGASFVLLWLAWQNLRVALVATVMAFISVLLISGVFYNLQSYYLMSALVLVVPMGIILDDVIHFFERYQRAEQQFFSSRQDKTRYALNSVGRAIWLTSQLLIVGLITLLFSKDALVQQASLMTIFSLLLLSFFILVVFPVMSARRAE